MTTAKTAVGTLLLIAFSGCRASLGTPGASTHQPEPTRHQAESSQSSETQGLVADVVAQAALPLNGFRYEDGRALSRKELLIELASFNAICLGENHDSAHHHFGQFSILKGLIELSAMNGRSLGLGLEMLPRSAQPALDAYLAGQTNEAEMLSQSRWSERWGYDYALYRPLVESAVNAGLELRALNVARELTRRVAKEGIGSLNEKELAALPELDFGSTSHKKWFRSQMARHPAPHSALDNMYAAQVLWDETMAESGAKWLQRQAPARQMVILAGHGHCRKDAIADRLRRRGVPQVASVRMLVVENDERPYRGEKNFDFAVVLSKKP